ncbi:MAG: BamA/TamA family outer membrane protein, partial [Calditrichota bacterium]
RKGAPASYAAHSNFDSLKVPYRAMAVDIREGKVYALGKGSLPQAMRSSMAIPLLFYPALYHDRLMVDGGVLDVLPTDVARQMGADILIAVDVTEKPNPKREPANLLEIANNTIDIMVDAQMERNARLADVLIVPPIGQHPDTRYTGLDVLIDQGYSAAKEKIREIKKLLEAKKVKKQVIKKRADLNALKNAKISAINIIGHKIASDNSNIITTKYRAADKPEKEFLKAGTILGYFLLKKGDTFNMDLALDGVENLYATGLFQNVWLELENDHHNKVVINIHYLQLPTRTIGVGANYYSDNGGAVFGQVVPFHFFGLGARFMPFVQYGEIQQRAGLEIANSRFFSTKFIFNGGGFYEMDKPKIYNKKGENNGQLKYEQVVGQFSFGLQPQKKLLFNLGIRGRRVWVTENMAVNQASVTNQYWSLYGNLVFDNRDNYYFPTRGGQLSLKGESILDFYLTGHRYKKLMATLDWTISIYHRHSFTPFGEFGLSEKEPPVYEKFRVGGPKIIPGYHRQEIWGNNFAAIGLNYRLNFYKKLNFQANWAMAEVFNKYKEVKLSGFINGVAAGFAFSSPIGPIAISYGWGETNREQLYFSLGYEF